jgi:hypothetical protein
VAGPLTGPGSAGTRDMRRAFVEFVRTHHPDVGGDPEAFRAGLAAFRTQRPRVPRTSSGGLGGNAGPIRVHRRRRGLGGLLSWLAAARARRRRPSRVH